MQQTAAITCVRRKTHAGVCGSTAHPFLLLSYAIQLAGKAIQHTPQILLHATVPNAASSFVPYSMCGTCQHGWCLGCLLDMICLVHG
jgi:hypothetical protein